MSEREVFIEVRCCDCEKRIRAGEPRIVVANTKVRCANCEYKRLMGGAK